MGLINCTGWKYTHIILHGFSYIDSLKINLIIKNLNHYLIVNIYLIDFAFDSAMGKFLICKGDISPLICNKIVLKYLWFKTCEIVAFKNTSIDRIIGI